LRFVRPLRHDRPDPANRHLALVDLPLDSSRSRCSERSMHSFASLPLSRRAFLELAGSVAPWPIAGPIAPATSRASRVLVLHLIGGPSQLDTFDPKPSAPREVRGPFDSIATQIPGVRFSELFPRLAARASQFAVMRTVWHGETPTHEASGTWLLGERAKSHGNGLQVDLSADPRRLACPLPPVRRPASPAICRGYGRGPLCWGCRAAVEWLEHGARKVTLSMFDGLTHRVTWDAHAQASVLPATLADYRDSLAPALDRALPALLDDLDARGLLAETLVVVGGEFGRTPLVNARGGRDHWRGCFSLLLAGAGVGGQVIGTSDAWAGEPRQDAVAASQVRATLDRIVGCSAGQRLADPLELVRSSS
jgi:hypothetical protein